MQLCKLFGATSLLLGLTAVQATAQIPTLVVDINQAPLTFSGLPAFLGTSGANSYLIANDGLTGNELYVTDALVTPGNATFVLDIRPGTSSAINSSSQVVAFGGPNSILFEANNGTNGEELWITDGTALGTTMVKDINVGGSGSSIFDFTPFAGKIFFSARDISGTELWATDGTNAGTVQIKDINTTSAFASSNPREFALLNGKLYFSADDGVFRRELWESDGTNAGTVRITDLNLAGNSLENTQHDGPKAVNGMLYFTATDGSSGKELWQSNGTAVGTTMVADLVAGTGSSDGSLLTPVGTKLYYRANNDLGVGTLVGAEMHVLETAVITPTPMLLKDIRPGTSGSFPSNLTPDPFTGLVYFTANDGSTGTELYVTDGSVLGTNQVKDIRPGSSSSSVSSIKPLLGNMLFRANQGAGNELWITDGTPAGTNILKIINTTPATTNGSVVGNLFPVGLTKIVFTADDGATGTELFETDGTVTGTFFNQNFRPEIPGLTKSSNPRNITEFKGKHYFQATDGFHGTEIWVSDGTAFGTLLLKDVNTTPSIVQNSSPANFFVVDDKLFFTADNGINGTELWVTAGTAGGTVLVKDQALTSTFNVGSSTRHKIAYDGKMIFQARDGIIGNELWVSDGTAAGSFLIKDLRVGASFDGGNPGNFIQFNGKVWFTARDNDANGNYELWKTDGTIAGTAQAFDFNSSAVGAQGVSSRTESIMVVLGDHLYFIGDSGDGVIGWALYRTDGTLAGTTLVKDLDPSTTNSVSAHELQVLGNKFYFQARVGALGFEPYVSDGTPAGTGLLGDLRAGSSSSSPVEFSWMEVGGVTMFKANSGLGTEWHTTDGVIGWALYRTDGTLAGTTLVKDLRPTDVGQAFIHELQVVGNKFYFQARYDNDINFGFEPFVSDGTPAGTGQLGDLRAGTSSSSPFEFSWREHNGVTMFVCNSGAGNEWHTTDGIPGGTTTQLIDINVGGSFTSGVISSTTANLLNVGSRHTYFQGDDGTNGRELWVTDGTVAGTVLTTDLNPSGNSTPINQNMARGDVLVRMDSGNLKGQEPYTYFPGASGQNLGNGCNKANNQASIPQISANDPVLDGLTSVSVVLDTDEPLTPCVIVIGAPGNTPIGGGCVLYTSFNVFTELSTTDANGDRLMFGVPVPVPANPALIGTTVVCQGVVNSAPTNPLGLAFSNAREVTGGL